MDIRDKVALVTGAGYGIGRGIALRLAAAGASVVVNDVHKEHGRETSSIIAEAGGKAAFVDADVTLDAEIRRAIAFAEETFGGLDILVNNVGTAKGAGIVDTTDAEWLAAFDQTLFPAVRASRLAVPLMRGPRAQTALR